MMSIMLDNHMMEQIGSDGFLRRGKFRPSILGSGDRTVGRVVVKEERENGLLPELCSSSSSSSIGMNSDDDDDDDEEEVESKVKISPFESAIDDLEQALPMRRGISKFYSGKSKSFASLSDAACSSIKDITKAENAYSRKRKNLLAHSLLFNKGRTSPPKIPGIGGGIEKRSTSAIRSTLALGVAMNNHESRIDENGSSAEMNERQDSRTPSLSPPLSPVPPPPWRSFSLADLQHCAVSASSLNSNLCSLMGKKNKRDEVS